MFQNTFNSTTETISTLISLKIRKIPEYQLHFLLWASWPASIWAAYFLSSLTELSSWEIPFLVCTGCSLLDLLFFSFLVYAPVLVVSTEKVHRRYICWDLAYLKNIFSPSHFPFGYEANLDKNIFQNPQGVSPMSSSFQFVTDKSEAIPIPSPVCPTHTSGVLKFHNPATCYGSFFTDCWVFKHFQPRD